MAKTTTKPAPNKPAHEIRVGAIRCTIWRNQSEQGLWYSTTMSRSYKAGEEWKESTQFGRDDFLVVNGLSSAAFNWIIQNQA